MAFKAILTKSDYVKTSLYSYWLQNGFNYGNYQGLGYAAILYPSLKKIYKDEPEKLKEHMLANVEFFNSNPNLLPFITSLHLVLLQNDTPPEEVRGIKMALMGPLAGIGDSLSQFCLAPLLATICASFAGDGLLLGPILFLLGMNGILCTLKIIMGLMGHKFGTNIIEVLSEKMAVVSDVASMIGVTVISGLAVTFVKLSTPIQYATVMADGKENVIAIQGMIDKIAPCLLPALFTLLILYLVKNRGWTTYKVVFLTIVMGILLSTLNLVA